MNKGIFDFRRLTSCFVAVAMAVLLAACGGDSDDGDTAAGEVDATAWAGDVCGQLVAWGQELQASATSMQSSLQTTGGSLEALRADLVNFLSDAVAKTDQMIQRIDDAGTPKTENGGEIRDGLSSGLGQVKKAFEDGKAQAESLPADDPGLFTQRATEIGNQAAGKIQQELTAFGEKYPSINQTFQQAPACKALTG